MKLLAALLDLLYPPKCVFCRSLLKHGEQHWCHSCERSLPYYDDLEHGRYYSYAIAPLRYQGVVRDAILRYKFSGMEYYAAAFAQLIAESIRYHRLEAQLLSWVPVSRARRKKRGYDQAELLCLAVSKQIGVPAVQLLEKTYDNRPQSSLTAEERSANVVGVYSIKKQQEMQGKTILLIDDILTTGATLSECCRVLLTAGARSVSCATLARTMEKLEESQVQDVSTDK